jgi:hypothetical protein
MPFNVEIQASLRSWVFLLRLPDELQEMEGGSFKILMGKNNVVKGNSVSTVLHLHSPVLFWSGFPLKTPLT